ncbi:four helix bundle protein [candidate division TA06 bacterium]|uniref:Four helix bundle protein n=1 Tax=candidate division TA06 bacterium TaxID=2250710 RepID=A0A523XW82_UNCT6|nr:MAG: four helix bundle protein [candidate division TA06 bacterium]
MENRSSENRRIESFEDLDVYRLARRFRKKVYQLTRRLPRDEQYNLGSQMRRAAVSLTSNLAEGYGRFHFQENMQFCRQSRGSLYELIEDLNICKDESYVTDDEYESYRKDAFRVLKVLNGYIRRTKRLQEERQGG